MTFYIKTALPIYTQNIMYLILSVVVLKLKSSLALPSGSCLTFWCVKGVYVSVCASVCVSSQTSQASGGVAVVPLGGIHAVGVKLPPLLHALPAALVLFCRKGDQLEVNWSSVPSVPCGLLSCLAVPYRHAPPQRSSQTPASSLGGTPACAGLRPDSSSAPLQAEGELLLQWNWKGPGSPSHQCHNNSATMKARVSIFYKLQCCL